ncbi:MAG TPA: hypothetical protein PKC47_14840, partial [Petrimonas sp.]|nr:hypothetical protein [Petrimonas sp.]
SIEKLFFHVLFYAYFWMDLDAKNNEKQHEEIRNKENIFVKLNEKNQTCLDFLIARKCLMNMKYKIQNSF